MEDAVLSARKKVSGVVVSQAFEPSMVLGSLCYDAVQEFKPEILRDPNRVWTIEIRSVVTTED